jgi:polar amino acid transport system substrate-binding protein
MHGGLMRSRLGCLAIAVGLIMAVSTTGRGEAACTLRTAYEPYGVYMFTGADGKAAGVDVDLVQAIADELGCVASFPKMPWARAIFELENGGLDVGTSASRTPERERFAHFSAPYRQAQMGIYIRKGESGRYALDGLSGITDAGIRLGVMRGYYYGSEFEALMADPAFARQVDNAVDYETNIRKLLHGRIDGFLVDDIGVMVGALTAYGAEDQVEQHPVFLAGDEFHLMLSRKSVSDSLAAEIDEVLARMEADGRLRNIMDKYIKK